MGNVVFWSDEAKIKFEDIIEYLLYKWTEKEVKDFVSRTTITITNLKIFPLIWQHSNQRKNIRRAVINKNVVLFYKYSRSQNKIELITLRNTKRKPQKYK